MDLTRHARTRMQQRGIDAAALDAFLDFGRVARAGRGRSRVQELRHPRLGSHRHDSRPPHAPHPPVTRLGSELEVRLFLVSGSDPDFSSELA